MARISNKFSKFLQELKHRKTDRVIVTYAATSFVILQLAEIFKSALSFPDWFSTFILIVLAIGFPVAAVFSWFFDITPGGIEKTRPVSERKKHVTEVQLKKWRSTTLISFLVIIALLIYNIASQTFGMGTDNAEKSIVVKPFGCIDKEEELIRNSVVFTESINGALASIENINLHTWPSNLEYQEREVSFKQIGKDLNISYILKGILNKNTLSDKITLIVQLIKATSESLLWGQSYTVEPDLKNINQIKNDITTNISKELNASLSQKERSRIFKKPSDNPEAMKEYYEGSAFSQRIIFNTSSGNKFFDDLIDSKFFEDAIHSFDLAIEKDSAFALAYAKRAIIRSWAYHTGHVDKSSVELCRMDINKALELDKELIETYIARGFYYYYCLKEFDKALENFSYANAQQPNNWQCIFYMALVQRAMGEWKKSQNLLAKVIEFNPQDPLVLTNIGLSESSLRHYEKAIQYQNKAIEIMPEWPAPYENKIDAILSKDGNTDEARRVLDTAFINTGKSLREIGIWLDIFDGKFEDALHEMQLSEPSDFSDRGNQLITYATIYKYLDKNDDAESFYREAISFYEQELAANPENFSYLSSMGLAYAGLGKKTEAIEAGEKAANQARSNSMEIMDRISDLAEIYVMTGEYEKCLTQLDRLLKNPSRISVKFLQLDPVWRPLSDNPKFKRLIANFSKR
jgi:tetratricopeptide (TPR) repeat protein